jgi:hypothetical protein
LNEEIDEMNAELGVVVVLVYAVQCIFDSISGQYHSNSTKGSSSANLYDHDEDLKFEEIDDKRVPTILLG